MASCGQFFWLPEERLAEKAARDRAPYDLWAEQGYLETTPGASIGYEFVAERLKDVFEETAPRPYSTPR